MKKYNKLTTLVLLIALVFTSFFIWEAQAAPPNPKVNIVTIEGNAEHLKPVELYASISNNLAYGNHPVFQLEKNEVNYEDDRPFLQQVDGHLNSFIDRLITDHRSFMRGKTRRPEHYIMTDDWIVYTAMATEVYWQDTVENELIISILNKQTKAEKEYRINLGDDVNYFNFHTASLNYPELSIALTKYDVDGEAEHLISTFDFENPDEELVEQINFTDKIGDEEFFYVGNTFDKTGRFIPFQSVQTIQATEEVYDDIYTDFRKTTGYFVYDIVERQLIDIPLFKENDTLLFTNQDQIYVVEDLGETLDFYEMNVDTESLEFTNTIDIVFSMEQVEPDFYHSLPDLNKMVDDGKLYVYNQQNFKGSYLPVFQVIDIEKNETLFLGRLDASDGSKIDAPNIDVIEYRLNPEIN